jgi:uroporphyrinogen III methyltransferase/synthase
VLVTRSREQAAGLAAPLESLGAAVLYFPVIEVVDPVDIAPLDAALRRLSTYDWLVLTSTNGVERFFDRLALIDPGTDVFSGVKVAVVGSATAAALAARGVEPALVPSDFRAEGLLAEFPAHGLGPGSRVLIARAEEAREILPEALRELGAEVDVAVSYRVISGDPDDEVLERLRHGDVDIATFASGGTFARFASALSAAGLDPKHVLDSMSLASVGPVTTAAIVSAGYVVDIEATESTMESLASAIADHCGRTGGC